MFLKKVCIFLAISFLAVDVFLLCIYFQANNNINTLSEKMLDNTVKYYESIGVELEKDTIVSKVPENKIYTFTKDNSAMGVTAANNLAEFLFSGKSDVNIVEIPRGMSYSITNNGENASSFRVYDDSFEFEYAHSSFTSDTSGIPSEPFSNTLTDIDDDAEKSISRFLTALYGQTKPQYEISGSYKVGERSTVCIEFHVDGGCPVEGMFANMVSENGVLVYAKGNIILSDIVKSYSEQLYDGVNALTKISTALISEFVSERIVYSHRYAGNGTYYLIPMWKIEYIDVKGNSQIQYVDAIKD